MNIVYRKIHPTQTFKRANAAVQTRYTVQTRYISSVLVMMFLFFGEGQVSAQEVLIEDFESYPVGSNFNEKTKFTYS